MRALILALLVVGCSGDDDGGGPPEAWAGTYSWQMTCTDTCDLSLKLEEADTLSLGNASIAICKGTAPMESGELRYDTFMITRGILHSTMNVETATGGTEEAYISFVVEDDRVPSAGGRLTTDNADNWTIRISKTSDAIHCP